MVETDIKPGRWQRNDGARFVVIAVAPHTEANYKLVVYHPENQPDNVMATPTTVWLERRSGGESYLFRRVE